MAFRVEVVHTDDAVGSSSPCLVAAGHDTFLDLQFLKDGLHTDIQFVNGQF